MPLITGRRALTDTVSAFGTGLDTPLYEQFCPLAFNNRGANWLAAGTEINNPCDGSMMLCCEEVRTGRTEQ